MKIIRNIQFAVVREDPEIEANLASRIPETGEILLIGSGGCTALSLASRFPTIKQTLIEPNPSQIELIQSKIHVLSTFKKEVLPAKFGIEIDTDEGLTSCGNFESLFKSLRLFLYEFVMERKYWLAFFLAKNERDFPVEIFQSKYWSVAFQLFFSDALLIAMFGPEAVQHAANSYANYFQTLFEKGLCAKHARENYFLHHVFLGHYLNATHCLPPYLVKPFPSHWHGFTFENTLAQNLDSFSKFDLLSFSNIFDWMPYADVAAMAARVSVEMKPGSWLVYRQLNNKNDYQVLFGDQLKFDIALAKQLHAQDRSLFYSSLHIAQKH